MAIYDVHHHWVNEAGYIDRLLAAMDRLGVERTGMIAMNGYVPDLFLLHPPQQGQASNDDLAKLIKQHGDRFWAWGFIRLGEHKPEDVDRLKDMGVSGLKFHIPWKPYGAEEYFPVYEKAEAYGLPCLFHTGLFYPPTPMPSQGIRSENCRPIHLEPIAHEFPSLKMIAAHLGVCWHEEAAALVRICPNIYADLSGRVDGWRSSKPASWFKQVLYWPEAHRKILFGSDVHADELEASINDHKRILQGLGWNEAQCQDVFSGNAKRLLGEST